MTALLITTAIAIVLWTARDPRPRSSDLASRDVIAALRERGPDRG